MSFHEVGRCFKTADFVHELDMLPCGPKLRSRVTYLQMVPGAGLNWTAKLLVPFILLQHKKMPTHVRTLVANGKQRDGMCVGR